MIVLAPVIAAHNRKDELKTQLCLTIKFISLVVVVGNGIALAVGTESTTRYKVDAIAFHASTLRLSSL